MKHILFSILGAMLFVISSCDWIWPPTVKSDFEELHSMVYIDISKSRDSLSVIRSIDKMEKIFLAQPNNVQIRFIVKAIDKDNDVPALFDHESAPLTDTRFDQVEAYKSTRMLQAKLMRENILHYFRSVTPNSKSRNQTCICNSLVNSTSYLSQLDTVRCKIQLFIFSDMFEECERDASIFEEGFSMCKGERGYKNSMKKLLQTLQDFAPETQLKNYVKPENLYFIKDSDQLYNDSAKKCLKPGEVRKLWKEIMIKLGYNQHDLNKIVMNDIVPSHLLKKADDV